MLDSIAIYYRNCRQPLARRAVEATELKSIIGAERIPIVKPVSPHGLTYRSPHFLGRKPSGSFGGSEQWNTTREEEKGLCTYTFDSPCQEQLPPRSHWCSQHACAPLALVCKAVEKVRWESTQSPGDRGEALQSVQCLNTHVGWIAESCLIIRSCCLCFICLVHVGPHG